MKSSPIRQGVPGRLVLAGRIHRELGENEAARDFFRRALLRDPRAFEAEVGLALLEADPRVAVRRWERVRQLSPGDLRGYREPARLYLEAGEYDRAEALLEAGLARVASTPESSQRSRWEAEFEFQLARSKLRRGQRAEATRRLRALLARQPQHQRAKRLLARAEAERAAAP